MQGGWLMKEILMSMVVGAVIGFVFKMINLPLPAPPALAGVTGILGVYMGGKIFEYIGKMF